MSDRYAQLVNSMPGRLIASRVGLPRPARLDRHRAGAPNISGAVLAGAAPGGRLEGEVERVLDSMGATRATGGEGPLKALVFDASGIADSTQLVELQRFFHPNVRRVQSSGRVVVLGTPPQGLAVKQAIAQRALEGFTRSLGKEIGRGSTVQLVYVEQGAEEQIDSTLRFLLSPRSAYVSGQTIRIGAPLISQAAGGSPPSLDWQKPLAGKRALVTGASRGIGEAIATVLHRDGAELVLLDVPALGEDLKKVAERLEAETIELDITGEDAPKQIADALSGASSGGTAGASSGGTAGAPGGGTAGASGEGTAGASGGGIDVVVHNAGVTRDRTLAKMPEDRWTGLVEINLSSEERINDELLSRGLLRENGRIVCVSSMSGIAGNAGQTNYATSKAGVIGMVEALAPELAQRHATINAVAPGFIETQMTAKMPIPIREAGRRMNSLSQGGLPVDVAETIAWFASPASAGVNGNVVRVCGQSLLGA